MAKSKKKSKSAKNNQPKNQVVEQNAEVVEENANAEVNTQVEAAPAKQENVKKADKKQKDNKKKAKKPVENKSNKVKETVAELKKVSWPTFGKVVKNTLLVLFIVVLSTLLLFGIDFGLSWIYKLLTGTL